MEWRAGLALAIDELRAHKLRTLLTLSGMIFGVGAVIAMLSVGAGAEREALRLIDTMGLRNVIVQAKTQPDEKLKETREDSLGLTLADRDAALETLPFVTQHTALKYVTTYSLFSHRGSSSARVVGVSPSHFEMTRLPLAKGRPISSFDDQTFAQVAVLGDRAADELFGHENPVGQSIKINHVWFTVVGVLANRGLSKDEFQGVKLSSAQNEIYLPIKSALKRFRFKPLEDEIDELHLEVREGTAPGKAAASIARLLQVRHRGVDDFSLLIPEALLEQHRKTQRIFNLVMACIAGISLLVGGIGIMNIMLANVLERTREIGIRRAVGARQCDIRDQFLLETMTITGIGAGLGIVVGLGMAALISVSSGWEIAWSLKSILLAVAVCAVVGLVSGIFPAIKAAKLDPIEALQRETG